MFDSIIGLACGVTHVGLDFRLSEKMAIYCPQGSGTLRQQLLMMHGIG